MEYLFNVESFEKKIFSNMVSLTGYLMVQEFPKCYDHKGSTSSVKLFAKH